MAPTTPLLSTLPFGGVQVIMVPQVWWPWPQQQGKQQKKAPGSPKIYNNFKPVGRRNLPRLAKGGGGVSELEAAGSMPKKWPQEGTPQKKARGNETFVFRVDHERTKAAKIKMVDTAHVDLLI
jgi:hypothetical protein